MSIATWSRQESLPAPTMACRRAPGLMEPTPLPVPVGTNGRQP